MTRMIRVADDVYRRLKGEKQPGETFSDTLHRLLGEGDLGRLRGLRSPAELDRVEDALAKADALDRPEV